MRRVLLCYNVIMQVKFIKASAKGFRAVGLRFVCLLIGLLGVVSGFSVHSSLRSEVSGEIGGELEFRSRTTGS